MEKSFWHVKVGQGRKRIQSKNLDNPWLFHLSFKNSSSSYRKRVPCAQNLILFWDFNWLTSFRFSPDKSPAFLKPWKKMQLAFHFRSEKSSVHSLLSQRSVLLQLHLHFLHFFLYINRKISNPHLFVCLLNWSYLISGFQWSLVMHSYHFFLQTASS